MQAKVDHRAEKSKKRQVPENFWKTPKGRAIIASRERAEERAIWQRLDGWN